jgi:hypothetical protein
MINKQTLGLADVKIALRDEKFRESLPEIFTEDLKKFLNNPGCGCNISFYKKLIKDARTELQRYYPEKEIIEEAEQIRKLSENNFSVINCHISDLEETLKKLGPGRKQIAMARYEEEITLVVNELDVLY